MADGTLAALAAQRYLEEPMREFIVKLSRSRWRTALGLALGAGAGAAYAAFVGCRTGTCPLTSNVWTAALFFGLSGALVGWPAKLPRSPEGENAQDRPVTRSPLAGP